MTVEKLLDDITHMVDLMEASEGGGTVFYDHDAATLRAAQALIREVKVLLPALDVVDSRKNQLISALKGVIQVSESIHRTLRTWERVESELQT
jgi:hypothetical protein